jgi:hypothetical protein
MSDKYAKYGTSYAQKVKYLNEKLEEEKAGNKKKPAGGTVMGAPILGIKDFSQEYKLRFIPSTETENWFYADIAYHYIAHPTMKRTDGKPLTVVTTCSEKYGKECYICTEWKKLMDMAPGSDWQEKRDYRSQERNKRENQFYLAKKKYFSPVIYNGELMVFIYGAMVRKQLEECFMNGRFGGCFNHPKEGFPVYVQKEKTGPQIFDVEYKVTYSNSEAGPIAKSDEAIDIILEKAPDVWTFVSEDHQWTEPGTLYTNPQLRTILQGGDKDFFRTANQSAIDDHGFVPDDTGISEWKELLQGNHFVEEATLSEEDNYDSMTKKELASLCKERGLRTSIKWSVDEYRDALRGKISADDIPF